MQTIVFIGSNKSGSSREAIKSAENLGYFTVLLTDRENFLKQRTEFPDVHKMIYANLQDHDLIREIIKNLQEIGLKIKATLSFIEPHVYQAAKLSEEICNTKVSTEAIFNMEDKIRTRKIMKKHPSSYFYTVFNNGNHLEEFIQNHLDKLPLIIKSPTSTGSKDVILAKDKKEFQGAIKNLIKKYDQTPILVEEYIEGPQYLVEALIENNRIHLIGIIEQTISFGERFIITGYSLLPYPDEELVSQISHAVDSICREMRMENGAAHFELRRVNGNLKLIEVNPRIAGGVMNQLIKAGTGIDLCQETIKLFLGEKITTKPTFLKFAHAHYLTINDSGELLKVTGKNRASKYSGVEEVYIKPRKGKFLRTPMSMGHRYGYVLATADDKESAIKIAREAAKEIQFHINTNLS